MKVRVNLMLLLLVWLPGALAATMILVLYEDCRLVPDLRIWLFLHVLSPPGFLYDIYVTAVVTR